MIRSARTSLLDKEQYVINLKLDRSKVVKVFVRFGYIDMSSLAVSGQSFGLGCDPWMSSGVFDTKGPLAFIEFSGPLRPGPGTFMGETSFREFTINKVNGVCIFEYEITVKYPWAKMEDVVIYIRMNPDFANHLFVNDESWLEIVTRE